MFASNFVPLSGGGGGGRPSSMGSRSVRTSSRTSCLIGVTPRFLADDGGDRDLAAATSPIAEGFGRSGVRLDQSSDGEAFLAEGRIRWRAAFGCGYVGEENDWFTVIGVVPDVNLYGVDPENPAPPAAAFVPYAYQQTLNTGLTIRVAGEPASITGAARREIRASDPNLPIFQVRTMDEAPAARLLAVRALRLDLRDHRRRRPAARVGRRLRRARRTPSRSAHRKSASASRSAPSRRRHEAHRRPRRAAGRDRRRDRPRARAARHVLRRALFYNVSPFDPISFGGGRAAPARGRVSRELSAGAARDEGGSGRRVARRVERQDQSFAPEDKASLHNTGDTGTNGARGVLFRKFLSESFSKNLLRGLREPPWSPCP